MNFWSNNGILTRGFYSSFKNPSPFWGMPWLPSDFCLNFINFPRFTIIIYEEAVDDNESDSEGDSDSDSNWFSVMYVAVKKIPLL